MQPVDTNRPGFQHPGLCPGLVGIGARRWRLRPSAGCGFLGASQLRLFLKLTHYQKPHLFCRIGRAFSPWAVALSVPRALPWAGMGARRWRLSIGRAFSPWAVALSVPRALPWAGMGARRWRLSIGRAFSPWAVALS